MQELEIEKRYLVVSDFDETDFLPQKNIEMEDVYVPNGPDHKDLRLRNKGGKYMVTRKRPVQDGDLTVMQETTIELSKEEFEALASGIDSNVTKVRQKGLFASIPCELDVFTGRHLGLRVLEFEFSSMEELEQFEKSHVFDGGLVDITNDERLAGGRLAEMSRESLKSLLAENYNFKF